MNIMLSGSDDMLLNCGGFPSRCVRRGLKECKISPKPQSLSDLVGLLVYDVVGNSYSGTFASASRVAGCALWNGGRIG